MRRAPLDETSLIQRIQGGDLPTYEDAQTGDVTLIVEEGSFRPVAWLSE